MPCVNGTFEIGSGDHAVGHTLGELHLERCGVVVNAIRRDGILGREPDANTVLREHDVLVLFGTPEDLERAEERILQG